MCAFSREVSLSLVASSPPSLSSSSSVCDGSLLDLVVRLLSDLLTAAHHPEKRFQKIRNFELRRAKYFGAIFRRPFARKKVRIQIDDFWDHNFSSQNGLK